MNQKVALEACAVAHGNPSVVVDAPQPQFGQGADIQVKQDNGSLMNVKAGANLAEVVKALNALGANPMDLLAILQANEGCRCLARRARSDLTTKMAINIPESAEPGGFDIKSAQDLRTQFAKNPQEGLKAAAEQFEAHVLQMVMKSMRDTVPQDGLLNSDSSRFYTGLLDQQMAQTWPASALALPA